MNPLLAIKIGNSNVTIGVFQDSTLIARWRAHTETTKTVDEYALLLEDFFAQAAFTPHEWRGAAIVSVVPPLTSTFEELCQRHLGIKPLVVGPKVKTGMPIRYDQPRALGADRLVVAVAAEAKYGAPVIVIDFGTATTFNVVNRASEFVGGAITLGLDMAGEALYRSTAQLPRIDLTFPPHVIATNPVHAIQSGILFGYLGMIEGMVARMRNELNEPAARVIATGGLAPMLMPYTRIIETTDRDLILDGLRMIFEMNERQ